MDALHSAFIDPVQAVQRDYSHPSIAGRCPLSEVHETLTDRTKLADVMRAMFLATKAADGTRPVIDASGWSHPVPETDVYDNHDYDQHPESFAKR